jgi:drug/metabolite transporter (DMT)-like permease
VRDFTAPFGRDVAVRTVLTGLLINTGTYALLFWGIQFIDSGVAGLINLSLVPVGLFVLSVLIGDERPRWRHALALAFGAIGLCVLFCNGATQIAAVAAIRSFPIVVKGLISTSAPDTESAARLDSPLPNDPR